MDGISIVDARQETVLSILEIKEDVIQDLPLLSGVITANVLPDIALCTQGMFAPQGIALFLRTISDMATMEDIMEDITATTIGEENFGED